MEQKTEYYQNLEVSQDSCEKEIKKAFLSLALK